MIQMSININESRIVDDLKKIAITEQDVEIIHEKNFNGTETIIEIFINSIPVITLLVPIIVEYIKTQKISKVKIDGDKIEIENVSEEFLKNFLEERLKKE